jgi:pimeloyl-ACP methyl ester carboxylesterase
MNSIHVDLLETETRYYRTKNFTTRVIECGSGTPLVLMHGGGGHAETWSRNLRRLGAHCRPMAMDFLWHGLSSKPPYRAGNWLKQFTEQVLELLDAIGAQKAVFEGESLGGWICMDLGVNHPERVEKLILNTSWGNRMPHDKGAADFTALRETSLNALHNPTPDLIRKRLDWLMPLGGVTDELVQLRLALWSRPDTRVALTEYYNRLFSPECEQYLFGDAELARISAPTLLLWTEKNPIAGPDEAARLNKIIRRSQVYVIKGTAHWPQWERPEEHDEVVLKFLRG